MDTIELAAATMLFLAQLLIVLTASGAVTAVTVIGFLRIVDIVIDRRRDRRRTAADEQPVAVGPQLRVVPTSGRDGLAPVWPNDAGAPE